VCVAVCRTGTFPSGEDRKDTIKPTAGESLSGGSKGGCC
jgi:hypothetical protein